MSDPVRISHQPGIVSLFLNRPERRNAMSLALLARLSDALSSEIREDTTAVIVSGVGGTFSAGADLADLTGTIDDLAMDDAIEKVTGRIRNLPVPVIAAIDGACMGGAVDLAISCDLRIASKDTFFQVPAARLGLLYSPGSIQKMYHLIGRDTVFRIMVLGERFDADSALLAGIVSKVVMQNSAYEEALIMARQQKDNLRLAVASTKRLLNELGTDEYESQYWEGIRRELLASPERHAAVREAQARHGGSPAGEEAE